MTKLRTANMLGALAGAIAERLEQQLKHHANQTDSSAAALNLLALYEGCSNNALSQALKLSHPATVRLIDKLESSALVERRQGSDRRSVALFLTPAGRERARATLKDRCVALEALVDVLTPVQRDQLDAIADVLLRAMTATPVEAAYTCRLCDEVHCPPDFCPVHQKATGLMAHG